MSNLVGKTLLERYTIQEFLGRGGMAEVYKVWDSRRMTYLAMKVMHEELALDRVFLRRFKREAQTLASLQHPNIVRYYGLEQDNRLAFILLDFITGETLKHRIFDARGPMPLEEIRSIMHAVCGALSYAHSEGFIHCDIKPGNIMIDGRGLVLLTDFGISRMADAATVTMLGAGTPAYMSPEQVRGDDPTPQMDIYSLGIVLYEMLTGGERPFTGEYAQTTGSTSEKVRWEQLHLAPPSPRKWNPDLSPELEAVILKCLAKEPAERFENVLALRNAFELAVSEKSGEDVPQPAESEDDQKEIQQVIPEPEAMGEPEPDDKQKKSFHPDQKSRIKSEQKTSAGPTSRNSQRHPYLIWASLGFLAIVVGGIFGLSRFKSPGIPLVITEIPSVTAILPSATAPTMATETPIPTQVILPTLSPVPEVLLNPSAPIGPENIDQMTLLAVWGDSINRLVYSQDGQKIAVLTGIHKIEILDADTLDDLHSIESTGNVVEISLSPQGDHVALGMEDGGIEIWNVNTSLLEQSLDGHTESIEEIEFTPDGKTLVTGSLDGFVKLWEVGTGQLLNTLEGSGGEITALAISPDGERLAYADYLYGGWVQGKGYSDDELNIYVWSIPAQESTTVLKPSGETRRESINYLEFSQDGSKLISDYRIWDITSGKSVKASSGKYDQYMYLPDDDLLLLTKKFEGRLFTEIEISKIATGAELFKMPISDSYFRWKFNQRLAISPDREWIAHVDDGLLQVSRLEDGSLLASKQFDKIADFVFSPDGDTIALAISDRIDVRNVSNGQNLHQLGGTGQNIQFLAYSPDGQKIAAGVASGSIQVWSPVTEKLLMTYRQEGKRLSGIEYSADGKYLAANYGTETILWEDLAEEPIRTLTGDREGMFFSGNQFLSLQIIGDGRNSAFHIWRIPENQPLATYRFDTLIFDFATNPDGSKLVYCANGNALRIIRLSDGSMLSKPTLPPDVWCSGVITWQESFIAEISYYGIQFYDPDSGEYLKGYSDYEEGPWGNAKFSPSNFILAALYEGRLRFYGIP